MTPIQQLYDFRTPLENGIEAALLASVPDISTWSPTRPPEFRKPRPRVEITANTGAAQGRHFPELEKTPVGGICHDQARAVGVTLRILTDADIIKHREYETLVRSVMATIIPAVNGSEPMTLHALEELNDGGSTGQYSPEDGVYATDINYIGQMTMQADAVEAILT